MSWFSFWKSFINPELARLAIPLVESPTNLRNRQTAHHFQFKPPRKPALCVIIFFTGWNDHQRACCRSPFQCVGVWAPHDDVMNILPSMCHYWARVIFLAARYRKSTHRNCICGYQSLQFDVGAPLNIPESCKSYHRWDDSWTSLTFFFSLGQLINTSSRHFPAATFIHHIQFASKPLKSLPSE